MSNPIPETNKTIEIILYAVSIIQLLFVVLIVLGGWIFKRFTKDFSILYKYKEDQQKECKECQIKIGKIETRLEAIK